MPWIFAGILVAIIVAASRTARAGTFRTAPREEDPETWRGAGEPPPELRPRPKFRAGEAVIESSSGKPVRRVVAEIAGVKRKAGWTWSYYFTDGVGAAENHVKRAGS